MSEKYRPCNGTEGYSFIDAWCGNCERDAKFQATGEDGCPIVADTFVYDADDPEYPKEWTFNDDGRPICTAFVLLGGKVERCENTADMFAEAGG